MLLWKLISILSVHCENLERTQAFDNMKEISDLNKNILYLSTEQLISGERTNIYYFIFVW